MSEQSRAAFETLKEREAAKLARRFVPRDADLFWIRLERYFEDAYLALTQLYGDHPDYREHFTAIFDGVADAYLARPEPLRLLDLERQITPDWFERPNMVGYVCYPQFFAGRLTDVMNKLDYLQELGITYLHLMSLLKPRPGKNDGGYAIMDYRAINPELGDMIDFNALTGELRERGVSVCVDLVLNHTAREHEWARRAMAGEEQYLECNVAPCVGRTRRIYPKVRQDRSSELPSQIPRQKREKIGQSSFVIVACANKFATTEETGLWPASCQELTR